MTYWRLPIVLIEKGKLMNIFNKMTKVCDTGWGFTINPHHTVGMSLKGYLKSTDDEERVDPGCFESGNLVIVTCYPDKGLTDIGIMASNLETSVKKLLKVIVENKGMKVPDIDAYLNSDTLNAHADLMALSNKHRVTINVEINTFRQEGITISEELRQISKNVKLTKQMTNAIVANNTIIYATIEGTDSLQMVSFIDHDFKHLLEDMLKYYEEE